MARDVQLNTRVEADLAARLDLLVAATGHSRSKLVYEAVRAYVESETQFLDAVQRGIADARAGRVTDHASVMAELDRRLAEQSP